MSEFEVRPAVEDDLDQIAEIYAHEVRHGAASWELTAPDLEEMKRRYLAARQRNYPYLVAEIDGTILGYAYVGSYRPRPAYRYTVENSIYLRRQDQGRNIAQILLTALIEACTDAGFRQMIAVIGDSANYPSIRFHEKMGFRRIGVIENIGWKFERWLDSVLMQLALGDGGETPPES